MSRAFLRTSRGIFHLPTPRISTSIQSPSLKFFPVCAMSTSTLAQRVPRSTWDSHMHVVDPKNYALSPSAKYIPHAHLLSDALAFEESVGISNIVFVQPSIYGNDNSCMLDALRELGPDRGRAVVTFDPATIETATLEEWHSVGVRGVRLNFKSVGAAVEEASLRETLEANAKVVGKYGWVIQLYIGLENVPLLEKIINNTPSLKGIKFCIDHLGHPSVPVSTSSSPPDPYTLSGFSSLISLLKSGQTWTKCSAAYRIESDPNFPWTQALAKEIIAQAPDRVVFATDWPHTRFDGHDVKPFMESCLEWCAGSEELVQKLFSHNAKELWDVKS